MSLVIYGAGLYGHRGMPQIRYILGTEPIAYQRESRWDQLTLELGPIERRTFVVAEHNNQGGEALLAARRASQLNVLPADACE